LGVAAPGFTLSPDGVIVGQAISSSVVTATVDDKTSAPVPVRVTIGPLVTTASGLQYQEMALGTGAVPQTGQTASVRFVGTLTDGTVFDQNSFSFRLGANQVVPGFNEGVLSMKTGGKRRLIIPPALGYNNNPPAGSKIPPGATLIFEVELVSIQ
jgi:peptidylprolyl isomerase